MDNEHAPRNDVKFVDSSGFYKRMNSMVEEADRHYINKNYYGCFVLLDRIWMTAKPYVKNKKCHDEFDNSLIEIENLLDHRDNQHQYQKAVNYIQAKTLLHKFQGRLLFEIKHLILPLNDIDPAFAISTGGR